MPSALARANAFGHTFWRAGEPFDVGRQKGQLENSEMFRRFSSRMGAAWCRLNHDSIMWPIHGRYECLNCGRHYAAFADAPTAGAAVRNIGTGAISGGGIKRRAMVEESLSAFGDEGSCDSLALVLTSLAVG
jgi:hypothetical protein